MTENYQPPAGAAFSGRRLPQHGTALVWLAAAP